MIYITKIEKETVSDLVTLIALKSRAIELGSVEYFVDNLTADYLYFNADCSKALCQIGSDFPEICDEYEVNNNNMFKELLVKCVPRELTIENAVKAIELAITVKGLDEIVKCIPDDMVDGSEEIKEAIVQRVYSLDK